MVRNFFIGGALLALIEGLQIFISNQLVQLPQAHDFGQQAVPPHITVQLGGSVETSLTDANSQALDISKVTSEAYRSSNNSWTQ